MLVTFRVLAGKLYGLVSWIEVYALPGAASQVVTHGSSTFAGVHALSTFRMLRLWRKASTFRHDAKTMPPTSGAADSHAKYERSEMSTILSTKLGFVHITTTGRYPICCNYQTSPN